MDNLQVRPKSIILSSLVLLPSNHLIRRMAEETVEKAVKTCLLHAPHKSHTEKLPLWGAHKFKPTLFITLMQNYGLDIGIHMFLIFTYEI
jgi:hypothetical protein